MSKRRPILYSAAELTFVESRRAMTRLELHTAFVKTFRRRDVTVEHIKSLCTRNNWTTDRKRWTPSDDAALRRLYPDTPTAQIAGRIGRTLSTTYQRARKLGLSKSAAYLASPAAGRTNGRQGIGTRFTKGHAPSNKGKPFPRRGRMAEGHFKKGGLPHNTKWLGHERVSKDGYVEISVAQKNPHTGFGRRYVLKHRWEWEQKHGPVPKGMALKCRDDRSNTDPSNWELVPRALLPRLSGPHGHGYDQAPVELRPTIMAIAKLEHATALADRREGEPAWKAWRRRRKQQKAS